MALPMPAAMGAADGGGGGAFDATPSLLDRLGSADGVVMDGETDAAAGGAPAALLSPFPPMPPMPPATAALFAHLLPAAAIASTPPPPPSPTATTAAASAAASSAAAAAFPATRRPSSVRSP